MSGGAPRGSEFGCLTALLAPVAGFMAVLSSDVLGGGFDYASRFLGWAIVVPPLLCVGSLVGCLAVIRRVRRWSTGRLAGVPVFVAMGALGVLTGLVLVPGWQRARCGAWKVKAMADVRSTIQGANSWREDRGSIPGSFKMLYLVNSLRPHELNHPCGPRWDDPLMIGTVRVDDWLDGKVSDAEAMAAAEAIPRSPDGWEQIGWHWYCQDDRAWAGWSSAVAVGFALSDPRDTGVAVGFADAHVEWVSRSDGERFAEIEAALAGFGLVPPGPVRALFERGQG